MQPAKKIRRLNMVSPPARNPRRARGNLQETMKGCRLSAPRPAANRRPARSALPILELIYATISAYPDGMANPGACRLRHRTAAGERRRDPARDAAAGDPAAFLRR